MEKLFWMRLSAAASTCPTLAVMASVVLARLGFVVVKLTMVFTPVLHFLRKSASRDIS
jgi:hypothetical protein